jgi:hypothetical protein
MMLGLRYIMASRRHDAIVAGTSIAQQVSEEMMSSGKEAVEADRAQALTIPVAAGAAVVIVILCSAVYSVLHYLF